MKRPAIAVVAAMLTLGVAGCGLAPDDRGGEATGNPGRPHNSADVEFSQAMIRSHAQAIQMAKSAETNASNEAVKQLALQIEKPLEPETEKMRGWLDEWDAKAPDESSHGEFPGIVDRNTMDELKSSRGPAFDRLFLNSMIANHEGAIAMATSVVSDGVHDLTADLAHVIIKRQRAEVAQMRKLLGS